MRSGAHATAGADFKFFSMFGAGAMIDLQQSAWSGAPSYATLNPYLTWRILGPVGLTLYTTVGLTRASPSRGVGLRLTL